MGVVTLSGLPINIVLSEEKNLVERGFMKVTVMTLALGMICLAFVHAILA